MKLSARLLELAASPDAGLARAFAQEAAELSRRAEELELQAHVLEALAALLPEHGPLRVGVRRYDEHVVAWIDTPGGAREGSGHSLADALLSAAAAGVISRRAARPPRQTGL